MTQLLTLSRFALLLITLAGAAAGRGADSSPAADAMPPSGDADERSCVERQQAYVDQAIAPADQSSPRATVEAVVAVPGFVDDMPYCSGARP